MVSKYVFHKDKYVSNDHMLIMVERFILNKQRTMYFKNKFLFVDKYTLFTLQTSFIDGTYFRLWRYFIQIRISAILVRKLSSKFLRNKTSYCNYLKATVAVHPFFLVFESTKTCPDKKKIRQASCLSSILFLLAIADS